MGGSQPDPEISGEAVSKKMFFRPFGLLCGLKIRGGPAPPESATVEEKEIRGGGVWADLELIELEHFCLKKVLVIKMQSNLTTFDVVIVY